MGPVWPLGAQEALGLPPLNAQWGSHTHKLLTDDSSSDSSHKGTIVRGSAVYNESCRSLTSHILPPHNLTTKRKYFYMWGMRAMGKLHYQTNCGDGARQLVVHVAIVCAKKIVVHVGYLRAMLGNTQRVHSCLFCAGGPTPVPKDKLPVDNFVRVLEFLKKRRTFLSTLESTEKCKVDQVKKDNRSTSS